MKPVLSFGRIMLGLAYVVYGYLHFAHTAADAAKSTSLLLSRSFFNDTATTEIYTLSLHDALPIWWAVALSFFTNILTRLSGVLASVLLFFVLFFAILPDFHGVSSWLSMASVLGLIGGSLQVAAYGEMWYRRKNRG